MVKSVSLFALVAVVLVAVSGSDVSKVFECCKTVTSKKIIEPILEYRVQRKNPPCVNAVIFQTQSGLYCINGRAHWVQAKILFSTITCTTFPPSASTGLPSSSSTSEMSTCETSDDENTSEQCFDSRSC
uniref:Chemokine interleukin-8-like domain-containing protein n=1 Tax=Astatotilapia calliptera TaxID=8154 RepID=A0A3P8PRK2_ASTCA